MADDQERFEAEIDLDVSFNEFDEELSEFQKENCNANVETTITNNNQKDTKQYASITNDPISCKDTCKLAVEEISETNRNCTESVANLAKIEDGEISGSSDGEDGEKMDCEEEIGVDLNPGQKTAKSAEDSKETVTSSYTFLPPSSVVEDCSKKDFSDEEVMRDTTKCVETESANISMESDNSMDDQSWKRHKRAKLENGSQETGEKKKNYGKDGEKVKTRGGRKKRKRPLRAHHGGERRHRNGDQGEPEFGKLFEPLRVTSDDSEEAVAKELAEKLNESKIMLIQRVVRCIGCEKALKLFKDTKEIQKHGGMWTQERDRRRTSGGIFLTLLKNRYVTKEQSKWIFAVENELAKQKAKEHQQKMKELHKKEVTDLRLKLKQKDND
ncbi:hypothetical protein ACROYT_G016090 [Oculina patagonica]